MKLGDVFLLVSEDFVMYNGSFVKAAALPNFNVFNEWIVIGIDREFVMDRGEFVSVEYLEIANANTGEKLRAQSGEFKSEVSIEGKEIVWNSKPKLVIEYRGKGWDI